VAAIHVDFQLYMSDVILYSMELQLRIRLILKRGSERFLLVAYIRTIDGTKKHVNKNNPAHSSGFNSYLATKTLENAFS